MKLSEITSQTCRRLTYLPISREPKILLFSVVSTFLLLLHHRVHKQDYTFSLLPKKRPKSLNPQLTSIRLIWYHFHTSGNHRPPKDEVS